MKNFRVYGFRPYKVAVIHGGPGGPGELASVARKLAKSFGVLEPLQTKDSVSGQIEELKITLDKHTQLPVVLIGHSWGAWLAFLFATQYPKYVEKLILVSSPAFEKKSKDKTENERLGRLNISEQKRMKELLDVLQKPDKQANKKFLELAKLAAKADAFDPVPHKSDLIKAQVEIFQKVWPEADKMRVDGSLLKLGKKISCPVLAIHGDHDPHPYKGVKEPLSKTIKKFKFVLLKKCGHRPWIERQAKEEFYRILNKEIV
ncbi:MAG: alpha/beta hydrolase [Candidatus Uhrbacteria bacterium]